MRAALIPADPAIPCRIINLAAGDYRAMASAIGAEYIERVRTPVLSMVLGVDELHMPTNRVVTVCLACGTDAGERLHPCPTVRLCDEIDEWAGVQR